MLDFRKFKEAVAKQFAAMSSFPLYRTKTSPDELWKVYLDSFPKGTNNLYRKRAEYDCSCCRQFIRKIGNVVAIVNGEIVSIWDGFCGEAVYQEVSKALSEFAKSHPIDNIFLHSEASIGTDHSFEALTGSESPQRWNHFFVNLPSAVVVKGPQIGPTLSETKSSYDVLSRSLRELTVDAVDTALELIANNSLYRGEEHKRTLEVFRELQQRYRESSLTGPQRDTFVWKALAHLSGSVTRIRNTSIGTLLIDLSEGVDLDVAVSKFETVVAPANYKRPTALVTPKMISAAKATLTELGLISALERRYARLNDVSVNELLFVDRSVRSSLKGDVFDDLAAKSMAPKDLRRIESVSIGQFLKDILPRAESLEILLENRLSSNLVSLIAPVDPTAKALFKWDNLFSWSYQGDLADSMKERVKRAGGNVTGDLCCRLAWYNYDDLDLHMYQPNGREIFFGGRTCPHSGGNLDVDMNAGAGTTRTPVENIVYPSRSRMQEGVYKLFVHQFRVRETTDTGFGVELDWLGEIHSFSYSKRLKDNEHVVIAEFEYTHAKGLQFIKSLPESTLSKSLWGLPTQQFHRVNAVMFSPNYWEDQRGIGNKHYFFMLEGCQNDAPARGFFNEYLRESLTPHRKVIEMVASKMKTEPDPHQLSGLGFSSTQRNELTLRVTGHFTRTVKIVF